MFKKENIAIVVSVIAIIIAIGGYSYPIAQDINAALGAFDIPTRFPNGHLDTNGGYYVDGTAIVNGSGALTSTTGTFSSTLGVSSTTPSTAVGELSIGGTGTTTLYIGSAGTKGGCIQTTNDAGTLTKIYVTGTTVTAAAGSCK